nr:nuclear transcription factor Y subunit A-4-like isoform X1 [Malus domestica]XP_028949633.1 nuclear transcription factor Y subunit A-4-like isoform X1 [Malus domestica]XP_028949634.1 nuclear transcription factor Y subunit A-4-like isoform X1 [Malus domestica]XP_028949635.1 nuclear transcription factor Y subunit A-4-like isoform X1 [Malus domestica]XP_028949637.1 nuclear transcription factor Y subunit A-4-like isoform X1 [Malus domestica]XP_028949638.1 nuclear transcription factor Y subunit A
MPLYTNSMSWIPSERQISESLSKDVSFKVVFPPQGYHDAKHLGLKLQTDQGSSSTTHSIVHSQGEDETCGKGADGKLKPVFLPSNQDLMSNPSQVGYGNLVGCIPYPYVDPYFSGFMTAYGSQAMSHMLGIVPTRVLLPPDLAQDGPIYVNAKQYRGILRRRQSRAKLEAQNKLLKARKRISGCVINETSSIQTMPYPLDTFKSMQPYLHESRHLHALNRVRGSGGRFLSTKRQSDQNASSSTHHVSDSISVLQKDTGDTESHHSESSEFLPSVAIHSDMTSVSNTNDNFRQPDRRFVGIPPHMSGAMEFHGGFMRAGNQHFASVVR